MRTRKRSKRNSKKSQLVQRRQINRNWFAATIIAQLRQRRLDLALTADQVNERCGFADAQIHKYESGQRSPSGFHLSVWTEAVGCTLTITPHEHVRRMVNIAQALAMRTVGIIAGPNQQSQG